jgi:pyrroline-5-carboxylate reductase
MLRRMRIGFIGAGNMASALARGLGEPALVADLNRERAEALAAEIGGEAVESNAAAAGRSDIVILCHKPAQLDAVAGEIRDEASAVVSILGGTPLAALEAAYPGRPLYRLMPSIPVEVRQGVVCYAPGTRAAEGPQEEVRELFGRLGTLIELPESLIDAATAVMGCGPAFYSLVIEALVDAGVAQGLSPDVAATMAVESMAGTAAVLRETDHDTRALRRRVTSPGGMTARGLAALERGGVRAAFGDAVAAVAEGRR